MTLEKPSEALLAAEAFLEAGLDLMEITLRTPTALECVAAVRSAFPFMHCGAGTILTTAQVEAAVKAGASFGVAPGLNESVVRAASVQGLPFIPGVITPTEIERALNLGCTLLKFCPAEPAGGAKYLKAVCAPYAHTGVAFLPLGSITPENLKPYLEIPQVAAIGGSWLQGGEALKNGDKAELVSLTRRAMDLVRA
jgi:2-dehydro-3-deoxyphosphogluconate aldolase/(4S)-4-hydroxy-2-oxoglutarate aldolase